jgi:hypothetical protein
LSEGGVGCSLSIWDVSPGGVRLLAESFDLEVSVPDESTIRKLTRRCGPELIDALNAELVGLAGDAGKVSLERVRADTTVVEADIKFPTDSGLLTSAIGRMAVRLGRLAKLGLKTPYVDRRRPAQALQHSIGVWLRRRNDDAKAEVLAITDQTRATPKMTTSPSRRRLDQRPHLSPARPSHPQLDQHTCSPPRLDPRQPTHPTDALPAKPRASAEPTISRGSN